MQTPPTITDTQALARNRSRASRRPAFFLHDTLRREVQQRLGEINKLFSSPAIISAFPEIWKSDFPTAHLVMENEDLALGVGRHDLVIHALSLHWTNDLVGQLVQCRRALRPDGLFLGFLFGGQTLNELRSALAQAEVSISGGLSARVLPMAEIRDLGALLQRAGLSLPVADSFTQTALYQDPLGLLHDLRNMGEASALDARPRSFTRRALFAQMAQIYQSHYGTTDGRVRASFEIICLTGWAPDESQQKPLRPGSSVTRLADALKAIEKPSAPNKQG